MDFSVIIQRLNDLTTFMNNVRTLSKKIFELPLETAGNKLVAVYNETSMETEQFDLTAALNGMYSLTNGITEIGEITRDGADFTFGVGFEWKINGIPYANSEAITRTINDAGTGNHRIDIAVCDTNNDIYIIEGFEVPLATAVVQPPTPPNTLFICSFLITESVIGDNTTPEFSGQNNVPLRVEILSTDLATNDIAGFVDYVNALNPPLNVLEITSLVQYYLTDSGDIYQLVNIGKGIYGQGALQITSSNVLKFTSGNPNLPTVLAQGNREILKIGDAVETYTTVLADRGKIIWIPSTATVFTDLIIDNLYNVGDTILIYSEAGGQFIKTTGTGAFLPNYMPEIDTVYSGDLMSITLIQNTGGDFYYTYNVMPYQVTSGVVSDGDKGDITVSGSGTVWTIDNQAITRPKLEHIQTAHVLGRHASGTGDVQEVSPTQLRTILNVQDGAQVNNISDTNATDLTDGGNTTLHTHDSRYYTETEVDGFLSAKENTITAGTTAQYYRGDKTFQTLNINAVSGLQTELDLKDVLPVLYEKHANVPIFGNTSLNNLEGVAFVISGGTSRSFADTNAYTRRQRLGLTVAVTGNLGQARQSITYFNRNSNLDIIVGVGFAENCSNANVRAFAGVSSNTGVFTNVEPTALTNCIGLAKLTTSNNVHLIHNDGSGTATSIDLGASFPSNTVETDFYILRLKTNGSNIDYTVTRVNTGGSTSGTLTTDLPATTQALNLGYYVVQSTGANTTTGIDFFGTNLIKS